MFKRMNPTTRRAIIFMSLFVGFAVVFASDQGWRHALGIGIVGVVTIAAFAALVQYASRPRSRYTKS
jgi:hypothetical protein